MEGMEKVASEQLAKLAISSENEETAASALSKLHAENRLKTKLREAKDISIAADLSADAKANRLYELLQRQVENTRRLDIEAASIRKKTINLQREKENLIAEIQSQREIKGKYESYCREIKKKNDSIIQECKEIEESEKKKLEELNEKIAKTMQEINEKLQENETEKNRLDEENKGMLAQMEELRKQCLARDTEFQNVIMEKDLELQLLKVQAEYKTGFEESQLKTQVDLYKNRFGEFQSIIEKSTEAYGIADVEIKKLDDKISSEKKANTELRKAKEKFDIELIQLFTEKNSLAEEIAKLKAQHAQIKNECGKLLQAKKASNN
jgi:hypothetical protein